MKPCIVRRLKKLENPSLSTKYYKSALVIYDPEIDTATLYSAQFNADVILLLPDNGRDQSLHRQISKSSYIIHST
jgi:hypothetical protein